MRESVCFTTIVAALIVLGGCETTGTTAASARYARLPTGVTLLDTDTARCPGTVQVREEQGGRFHDQELVLEPGENATFTVDVRDGDRLEWSCIGDTRSVSNRVDCPDSTSHVRISRRAEGADLMLECYGRRVVGRS